nr:RloB domain-containing protein [Sphingomonas sp. PAMC 26605]
MRKADGAGVKVALCNVCFEYWILLHFLDTDAPYQSFEDLIKRSPLNGAVKEACGCNYDKASRSLFEHLKERVPVARERGKRLNERGKSSAANAKDKSYHINPYVGIVELLDAIDAFD